MYLSSLVRIDFNESIKNHSASKIADPVFYVQSGKFNTIKVPLYDPDGDLLKYKLVATKGFKGIDAPVYFLPS